MVDRLRQHITGILGRAPENLSLVLSRFEPMRAKRGDHLLQEGDVCRYAYFIVEGCIQVYVIDARGHESTREFYVEDQWVTDIFGFQNQTPSTEYIKCIEPAGLLRISHASFQEMCATVPEFASMYRQILEVSYNNTVYRVNTLTALSGLDRLRWFYDHKPRLRNRLPSRLIASYLGLSPETVTRLKAKL
ncbi:CRP-like cAMP-binding protein [Neolewinella xylanilytica]|uniref:CRP-like cAMP-binding protein n=1 Tax=Neolewinella xylanilytica TaxID=1514080 RepID=A0A2S6I791_9BACT|nr:Crp/Fnr family transcriptional regulator [Neolewinella xylanilytica]PPK87365.1 CRP-like cAMP-binding protein [Neolewinella xylanilytica]